MSTNKRSSATAAEQTHGNKRSKPTITADTVDVNAVMTSEGPIVTVVVLRTNGECEELVLDMSPKLQLVAKELRGSVGFLGQWESLEVVLIMRADQDDSSFDMNSHKLQPPFDEAEVRGDILLMRNDEDGIPANFTLTEYHEFQELVIPKWEPGGQDDGDDDGEIFRQLLVFANRSHFPAQNLEVDVSSHRCLRNTTQTRSARMKRKIRRKWMMNQKTNLTTKKWSHSCKLHLLMNDIILP